MSRLLPGVIWIDLLNRTKEEVAFIERRTKIRIPSAEILSEIDSSRPTRHQTLEEQLFLTADSDEFQLGFHRRSCISISVRDAASPTS